MTHRLEADSIQLEFDGRKILSDIYLTCETGKITGLLGRNGQGKSCLMQIIYGSMPCEKSVRIDHTAQPAAYKYPALLRYLPQSRFIPPFLSLRRIFADFNLEYSAFVKRFPEFKPRYSSAIKELSGGERRLVELYVIACSTSYFVMLDEPFTHLNPLQVEKVKELLLEEKKNKGILMTDHMYQNIMDVSDHLYLLSDGKAHVVRHAGDIERLGYARGR